MLTKEHADYLRTVAALIAVERPSAVEATELSNVATLIDAKVDSTKRSNEQYAELQAIGKGAAESITEMVAALECDYDRLDELKEMQRDYLADQQNSEEDRAEPDLSDEEKEELKELREAAGDCESREDAEQRIHENSLSVQVRSSEWHEVGAEPAPPDEFEILLGTGGPATRIIGEFNEHGEPTRAQIQAQDWGTPWTDYRGDTIEQETLLTYCRCFVFSAE